MALNDGKRGPDRPTARRACGAVVWRRRFHLLGGFGTAGTVAPDDVGSDLWSHGDAGWTPISSDTGPGARYPSLATRGDELWRFGGCGWRDGAVTFEDGIWRFDDELGRFAPVEPAGSPRPAPRYTSAFFAAGDRLVVFGGNGRSETVRSIYYGDLWAFEPASARWELLHDETVGPGRRYGFGWAVLKGDLYLFGGFDGTSDRSDFWRLDGGTLTWTRLPDGPPERYCPALGAADGGLALFGGRSKTRPKLNLSDTWFYDPAAGTWREVEGAGPGYHAKPGYASDGARLWVYGGEGPHGHLSDLWAYAAGGWSRLQGCRDDDPVFW